MGSCKGIKYCKCIIIKTIYVSKYLKFIKNEISFSIHQICFFLASVSLRFTCFAPLWHFSVVRVTTLDHLWTTVREHWSSWPLLSERGGAIVQSVSGRCEGLSWFLSSSLLFSSSSLPPSGSSWKLRQCEAPGMRWRWWTTRFQLPLM